MTTFTRIHPMKKNDPNQTMLDLSVAINGLHAALGNLSNAALAAYQVPGQQKVVRDQMLMASKIMRKEIRRLIGILHDQTGRSFHELWILCYHRFFQLTGLHPVALNKERGKKPHLDVVESLGLMPELEKVLLQMLVDPQLVPVH